MPIKNAATRQMCSSVCLRVPRSEGRERLRYLAGMSAFAAASAPIFLPIAEPTSVEFRK